jgi:hypothetical protein
LVAMINKPLPKSNIDTSSGVSTGTP